MRITEELKAKSVELTQNELIAELEDGSRHSAPISLFPILSEGTPEERSEWYFLGGGRGIHWPLLDEHISIASIVAPEQTVLISEEMIERHIAALRERRKQRSA